MPDKLWDAELFYVICDDTILFNLENLILLYINMNATSYQYEKKNLTRKKIWA